jgi:hypothetical protein
MKADEVLPVERQHGAIQLDGQSKNAVVRYGLAAASILLHGEYVVAEPSQFQHDRVAEIFIGVEAGHDGLSFLIRSHGLVDFLPVRFVVRRCRVQVILRQVRVLFQYLSVGGAELSILHQQPNGEARVPYPCGTAANVGEFRPDPLANQSVGRVILLAGHANLSESHDDHLPFLYGLMRPSPVVASTISSLSAVAWNKQYESWCA